MSLPTFKGWVRGKYSIWVRSNEDAFNRFDDKVYNFECLADGKRPIFKSVNTGTTNAGAYGLMNFENYNPKGCAILKSDIIIYNSHVHGISKGKEVYRQAKAWPYYRDNNKNKKVEEIGKLIEGEIIYAHQHAAGLESLQIDNWSTACLVRNDMVEYKNWLAFMNKQPCNTAILKEW
jgi:hypothetical protein